MTGSGQLRIGRRRWSLAVVWATSMALGGCVPGVAGPSPSWVVGATGPTGTDPTEASPGLSPPATPETPDSTSAAPDCAARAASVRGWQGTVSWSYELQRAGISSSYDPAQRQAIGLNQAASMTIEANDVELYPGPDGSPLAANWFGSRITGSANVDDESICTTCDTTDGSFQANGSGAPATEGPAGDAGRDPNFSNFVLTVLFDECKYSFISAAYVAGLNTQHPTDPRVFVGLVSLASDPPRMRTITDPDLTLSGSGSFTAAYEGFPPPDSSGDGLTLGGLSSEVGSNGLGTSGDSSATVSWLLTPILP
jgi:hypothetical protein